MTPHIEISSFCAGAAAMLLLACVKERLPFLGFAFTIMIIVMIVAPVMMVGPKP